MNERAATSRLEPPAVCRARLRDGTEVIIRPLEPTDEGQLRMGLEHLSPKARYQRFLTPTVRLSDAQFDYLVHPDGLDHLAMVMGVEVEGEPEPRGIAVARCVRSPEGDRSLAEVAVVVVDEYQGRGAGSLLLRHLAAWAHRSGIRRWLGILLASNEAVKKAIDHVGPRVQTDPEGSGIIDVIWQLDPGTFGTSPAGAS